MSGDKRYVLAAVPDQGGRVLDLGGGRGELGQSLRDRGFRYVNLDLTPSGSDAVIGDAQRMPIRTETFELVVSSDSLEHFPDPSSALREVRRILVPGGTFVVWVPFLHPFHGDDFYRYTPLGLRWLLEREGFVIERLEAPLWIATVIATALLSPLRGDAFSGVVGAVKRAAVWIDERLRRFQGSNLSYAAAYLVVARSARGS